MTWKILNFLNQEASQTETPQESKKCFCGNGKLLENCHELEHALPPGERPDPD